MEPDIQRNFVIIGRIRTGTTKLCSALDAHSKICCKLELLNRRRYKLGIDKIESYLVDNIYGPSIPEPVRGFKVMYHQLWGRETPEFYWLCNVLKNFDTKVIHVTRKNFLDHYLSIMLARQCDIWNAWADRRIDKHFVMIDHDTLEKYNQPVKIDLSRFELKYKSQRRWEQLINDVFHDALPVDYDMDHTAVLKWLGLEMEDISPSTIRMRNKPKEDLIENYDEVADYLRKTNREWMLDAVS